MPLDELIDAVGTAAVEGVLGEVGSAAAEHAVGHAGDAAIDAAESVADPSPVSATWSTRDLFNMVRLAWMLGPLSLVVVLLPLTLLVLVVAGSILYPWMVGLPLLGLSVVTVVSMVLLRWRQRRRLSRWAAIDGAPPDEAASSVA